MGNNFTRAIKTVEKLFDRFYCARKIVTHLDFNYNISFANYQL